jgi:tetratricopeptide (TPR) repeat protein
LLAVADKVLAGWIDTAAGRYDDAEHNLREAVAREDALLYGEPPEWTVPVRQDLGAALMVAGRYKKAEQAFREDLERFPKNGWSLYGLASALRAQGQKNEAEMVRQEFDKAWENADMEPAVAFAQKIDSSITAP